MQKICLFVALVAAAAVALPAAAGESLSLQGVAHTEGEAEDVDVNVWQIGPPLAEHPERLWAPVFAGTARAGEPFSIDLPAADLPLRVELSAPGHVAMAQRVIVAEQAELPAAYLRTGRKLAVVVGTRGKAAEQVLVRGGIEVRTGFGGGAYRDRWRTVVPATVAEKGGTVEAVVPDLQVGLSVDGVDRKGRWGRVEREEFDSNRVTLALDSPGIRVRVVDHRERPVAGARVAAAQAPAGAAAETGEDGKAKVHVPARGSWSVVALAEGAAGQTAGHGRPVAELRLQADELRLAEVGWQGAPGPVILEPEWLPRALLVTPVVLRAGPGKLPLIGPRASCLAWGPHASPSRAPFERNAGPQVLRLVETARVNGRVVGSDGSAVAGAPVWAHVPAWWEVIARRRRPASVRSRLERQWLPWAVSGPDGCFAIAGMAAMKAELEARMAPFPPARSETLELEAGASAAVTLTLEAGGTISLTAVDPDAQPLAGARVTAARSTGREGRLRRLYLGAGEQPPDPDVEAFTDEDGSAVLSGVPRGQVDVALALAGYVARTLGDVEVCEEGVDLGEVVLEPGVTLAGRTVDPDGRPVPEAEVMLRRDPEHVMFFNATTRCDGEGRFEIADLEPRGEVYLQANADGMVARPPVKVELPPEGEVEVPLAPEKVLEGIVVAADGGHPVAGAMVRLQKRFEGARMSAMGQVGAAQADDDGRFRINKIGPGGYEAYVSAEEYRSVSRSLVVADDEDLEPLRIELERGLELYGRVLDPDGRPAAGLDVNARPTEARSGGSYGSGGTATTDAEGRFVIAGLADREYRLYVADRDGASAEATHSASTAEEVVLRLRAAGSVAGTVLAPDGSPVADARVWLRSLIWSGARSQVETGADGRFRMPGVAPGEVRLSVRAEGWQNASAEATVESGQETAVEIVLESGGVVTGRVVGLSTAELERCMVAGAGQVNADGSFRVEGVPPGRREITATVYPEQRTRGVVVEVPADGQPVEVEIDFGDGLTLSGVVRRGWRPVAGMTITVERVAGRGGSSTVSGDDGTWVVRDLVAGEYEVSARSASGQAAAGKIVLLERDDEVELQIAGGGLAGWVLSAATRLPVTGARVMVVEDGPPRVEHKGSIDRQGRFELADLAEGEVTVRATAEGFAPAREVVAIGEGQTAEVTLLLEAEQGVLLVVRGAEGAFPPEIGFLPMTAGRVGGFGVATCDGEGRCRVTTLAAGMHTLYVTTGDESAVVAVTVPGGEVPVALRREGRLTVHARPDDSELLWRVRCVDLASGLVVPMSAYREAVVDGWIPVGAGGLRLGLPAGVYRIEGYGPAEETPVREVTITADGGTEIELP